MLLWSVDKEALEKTGKSICSFLSSAALCVLIARRFYLSLSDESLCIARHYNSHEKEVFVCVLTQAPDWKLASVSDRCTAWSTQMLFFFYSKGAACKKSWFLRLKPNSIVGRVGHHLLGMRPSFKTPTTQRDRVCCSELLVELLCAAVRHDLSSWG